MIIDGHAHACGMFLDEQSVLKNLKEQGVDKVILSIGEPGSKKQYNLPSLGNIFRSSKLFYMNNKLISQMVGKKGYTKYFDEENRRLAKMAQAYPNQILNTYWINICEENSIEKMEQFEYPFAMIKVHQCWTPFSMKDKNMIRCIEWAEKKHKPIFIHLLSQSQVKEFIEIAQKYINNIFIVAHLIGVEEFNTELNNKNIYFDISCPELYSLSMLKRAYKLVGAERILLGSDSPYGRDNIKKAMARVEKLNLTLEEKELIYGHNLERLLNL